MAGEQKEGDIENLVHKLVDEVNENNENEEVLPRISELLENAERRSSIRLNKLSDTTDLDNDMPPPKTVQMNEPKERKRSSVSSFLGVLSRSVKFSVRSLLSDSPPDPNYMSDVGNSEDELASLAESENEDEDENEDTTLGSSITGNVLDKGNETPASNRVVLMEKHETTPTQSEETVMLGAVPAGNEQSTNMLFVRHKTSEEPDHITDILRVGTYQFQKKRFDKNFNLQNLWWHEIVLCIMIIACITITSWISYEESKVDVLRNSYALSNTSISSDDLTSTLETFNRKGIVGTAISLSVFGFLLLGVCLWLRAFYLKRKGYGLIAMVNIFMDTAFIILLLNLLIPVEDDKENFYCHEINAIYITIMVLVLFSPCCFYISSIVNRKSSGRDEDLSLEAALYHGVCCLIVFPSRVLEVLSVVDNGVFVISGVPLLVGVFIVLFLLFMLYDYRQREADITKKTHHRDRILSQVFGARASTLPRRNSLGDAGHGSTRIGSQGHNTLQASLPRHRRSVDSGGSHTLSRSKSFDQFLAHLETEDKVHNDSAPVWFFCSAIFFTVVWVFSMAIFGENFGMLDGICNYKLLFSIWGTYCAAPLILLAIWSTCNRTTRKAEDTPRSFSRKSRKKYKPDFVIDVTRTRSMQSSLPRGKRR